MTRSRSSILLVFAMLHGCAGTAPHDPPQVATTSPLALTRATGTDGLAVLRFGDAVVADIEVRTPPRVREEDGPIATTRIDGAFQYRVFFDSGERWDVRCAFASRDEWRRGLWSPDRDQGELHCALRRADTPAPTYVLDAYTATGPDLLGARVVDGAVTPEDVGDGASARRAGLRGTLAVPVLTIEGSGLTWGIALAMRETTLADDASPVTRTLSVPEPIVGAATLEGAPTMRLRDDLDAGVRSLVGVTGSVLFVLGQAGAVARAPIAVRGSGSASTPVAAVALAAEGMCALHVDGAVICRNGDEPPFHAADGDVQAIATRGAHVCMRMTDGALRCALRAPTDVLGPRVLGAEGRGVFALSDAPRLRACVTDPTGGVACFGDVAGFGITHPLGRDDPGLVTIPETRDVIGLAMRADADDAVFALTGDGRVRVVAQETRDGADGPARATALLEGPATVAHARALSVGDVNACVVREGGAVACWGEDLAWDTADAPRASPRPLDVEGIHDAVEVAVGFGHACARTRSGHVACWGGNVHGALGDGTTRSRLGARPVPGLSDVTAIASASSTTCAIAGGRLMCWGEGVAEGGADARSPVLVAL